jgi:hypothetical protein
VSKETFVGGAKLMAMAVARFAKENEEKSSDQSHESQYTEIVMERNHGILFYYENDDLLKMMMISASCL